MIWLVNLMLVAVIADLQGKEQEIAVAVDQCIKPNLRAST